MRNLKLLGALGVVLALSSGARAAPLISDGLFVYYSFDNVSGSTVYDGSSNGYNGTVYGTITYESGQVGNAANFKTDITTPYGTTATNPDYSLADNNYITLPTAALSNSPTSNITISAWCRIETDWTSEIFNAELVYPDDRKSAVHVEAPSGSNQHRLCLRDSGKDIICDFRSPTDSFVADEWHHVAVSYSAADQLAKIYLDGERIAYANTPLDAAGSNIGAWETALLGVTNDSCRQYYGLMDEFYIYDKTLSESAVYALAKTSVVGDANYDGSVNLLDLTILSTNWSDSGMGWGQGDFNDDGEVNLLDLTILSNHWDDTGVSFQQAAASVGLTVVPEPGTFVLIVSAALALVAVAIRRRRA